MKCRIQSFPTKIEYSRIESFYNHSPQFHFWATTRKADGPVISISDVPFRYSCGLFIHTHQVVLFLVQVNKIGQNFRGIIIFVSVVRCQHLSEVLSWILHTMLNFLLLILTPYKISYFYVSRALPLRSRGRQEQNTTWWALHKSVEGVCCCSDGGVRYRRRRYPDIHIRIGRHCWHENLRAPSHYYFILRSACDLEYQDPTSLKSKELASQNWEGWTFHISTHRRKANFLVEWNASFKDDTHVWLDQIRTFDGLVVFDLSGVECRLVFCV